VASVADLVESIAAVYADGYGELAIALHAGGWRHEGQGMLEPVVDVLHAARRRTGGRPLRRVETRLAVAALHQALATDPVYGAAFRNSVGIGDPAASDPRAQRRWCAAAPCACNCRVIVSLAPTSAATRTEAVMTMDSRADAAAVLLRTRGTDGIDHPGGTLLAHLVRVRTLLAEWSAADDVQLAGLCHAAYGTDGFRVALLALDERPVLAQVIGPSAEALVYLYASCDRKHTYAHLAKPVVTFTDRFTGTRHTPAPATLRAFMEITAANELDVLRHNPEFARRYGADLAELLADAGEHLSEPARRAWATQQAAAS
jgi:hypothetical protein